MGRAAIGKISLHRIEEWQGGFAPGSQLFSDYDDATWQRHEPEFVPDFFEVASGRIYGFLQSWVLDTGSERILFDTGAGNDKDRPGIPVFGNLQTDFLDRLAAAGYLPEDIDTVICSHLHIDHVGWNTRLVDGRWDATFRNARYLLPAGDRDYWDPACDTVSPSAVGQIVNGGVFEDSVQPLIDAGRSTWVDDGYEVAPGLDLFRVPGHTPGHLALRVRSEGESALFVGDVVHHPVQVHEPHWNSQYCEDQDAARDTRRRVLEEAATTGALLIPAHFGGAHMVHVAQEGSHFRPVY